ncbi:MAG TPA: hypothetical protein VGM41_20015 [Chitinophagaceae bacterium]
MSWGTRGLFINNKKAQDSIHESGVMVFNCLRLSDRYQLDYIEISQSERILPLGYDFYFFNYHPGTMFWMDTSGLKGLNALVITMVLEVSPGDPFVMCPEKHFDGYCVLDPTITSRNKTVFAFPRPLEAVAGIRPYTAPPIPIIGSFGFATRGKGFQHVVDAVNKEFDRALVRINIPYGDFVKDSEAYSKFLAKLCIERAKEGIEVVVTHDYMSKAELINWCAVNTLNCFLYDRNMPGLAATTDQAIVSGRPLAVSGNDTFRHITSYLPPYPEWSLKEAIEKSPAIVRQMAEDWSPANFVLLFEKTLQVLQSRRRAKTPDTASGSFEIPLFKKTLFTALAQRYRKYKRLFTLRKIKRLFSSAPQNTV